MQVTLEHLEAQIAVMEGEGDPNLDMSQWVCETSHCFYGGAALIAGLPAETIMDGVSEDWDVGEDTGLWRRFFLLAGLSHEQALLIAKSIGGGRFNLSGANLTGADLYRADLTRANLTGANLTGANLARANLNWADLTGANLAGADLTGADLSEADLTGANLTGANLNWADLEGANLAGADLTGANLTGADLTGAIAE